MDKQAWEGVTCRVASFRQALKGGLCCSGVRHKDTEPPARTHTETPGCVSRRTAPARAPCPSLVRELCGPHLSVLQIRGRSGPQAFQ